MRQNGQPGNVSGCDRRRYGFTLVELLVVMAIISILVALLMPAIGNARRLAQSAACRSNLRQMTIAFLRHNNDHRQLFQLNHQRWHWRTYQGNLQMQPYVTGTDRWPYERGAVTTIATCPTMNTIGTSWCGLTSTYMLNVRASYQVDTDEVVTSRGALSMARVVYPSEMLCWVDGETSGEPLSNGMLWFTKPAWSTYLLRNRAVLNGIPVPYAHDRHVNLSFMDGHVSSRTIEESRAVEDDAAAKERFWYGR